MFTKTSARPLLSLCIPAYNRARFLTELLESVFSQGSDVAACVEIVISEDASPERKQIRALVQAAESWPAAAGWTLRYSEAPHNLGYDGNLRRLLSLARGEFCFFLGNDDVLAPGALRICLAHLRAQPQVGLVLRGYAWFRGTTENIVGSVRYATKTTLLAAGAEALTVCFRRSGVISGYIVATDLAQAAATARFDGTLYYQMHLTASVCAVRPALIVAEILVLCRDETPPDFGAADSERGRFVQGRYTPDARVHMLAGALQILDFHCAAAGGTTRTTRTTRNRVLRDYARHFYPFVMDQLGLPWRAYLNMCRAMARTPVGRYPSFYVNCVLPYCLGRRRTDACIGFVRRWLGRTPRL